MGGLFGLLLVIAFVVAAGIAGMTGRNGPPSAGRFILRFIIAMVVVIFVAVLLLFGACAIMFGGGCINC